MAKKMLIDATHAEETRVVVVDGNKVEEFDFESENKRQLAGNIYLAKVTRVEPSLQAAFVDYGGNRHGFLAFSEIHPDYYQIPVADREALMEEERAYAEAQRAREEEDEKPKPTRKRSRKSTKAEKTKSGDVSATRDVSGDISGMETIDLEAEDESTAQSEPVADAAAGTEASAGTDAAAPMADGTAPADSPKDTAEPVVVAAAHDAADVADVAASSDDGSPAAETAVDTPAEDSAGAAPQSAAPAEAAADLQATTDSTDASGEDASTAEAPVTPVPPGEDDDDTDDDDDNGAASSAAAKDETIESVSDDDDQEDIRPIRKPRPRRYKIQEVIKVRQILLVQVVKEERGNKGAALTTYLSLAGRYCVLMPNTARGGGISRKITNASDRKKLKAIAGEIDVPTGAGLIIRTAGAKRTKTEIKRDYEYLQRLWEQIRELTLKSIAPAKIYEEGDLIKRSIRDLYNREIDQVLVEGERGYRIAKDFMKMIMPSHAKNVQQYADQMPLFARFQVESYLGGMFNPTVQLKSGGYIVIGVTEALVAIDVNSGRATKEGSIEETALKTNLEAADEVARQLRLRDLAGLIVIDFIDMDERKNNAAVEKRIKDKLKTDRARIQVGRISGFGLMEMSRQRLRPGMIEATTQPCPHCHGTGLIRSDDNMALSILRQIEEEGTRRRSREVLVKCPVGISNFLMNQKREHVATIEARYGLSVRIEGDPMLVSPDFSLEKFKTATRSVPEATAPVVSVDTSLMDEIDEMATETEEDEAPTAVAEDGEAKPKKRRRRRRRKKSGSSTEAAAEGQQDDATSDGASDKADVADGATDPVTEEPADARTPETEETEDAPKPKKRRTRSRRKKPAAASTEDKPADDGDAGLAASDDIQSATEDKVSAKPETADDAKGVAAPAEGTDADSTPEKRETADHAGTVDALAPEAETEPMTSEAETPTAEPKNDTDSPAPVAAEVPDTAEVEAAEVEAAQAANGSGEETAPSDDAILSETPAEPAPEPPAAHVMETAEIAEDPAPAAPPKPKRRGWWSR
ncbi:MAG: Rne/Rng family ribonuclease [Rhodobacteraceae bacterium]|nr:Rne/Rng family ribonuclease [Paracoccaceae bacterium]